MATENVVVRSLVSDGYVTVGKSYFADLDREGDAHLHRDDTGARRFLFASTREFELVTDEPAPATSSTDDIVVKPPHYTQYAIEPITFIMKNGLSFETGNMVKYALRAGKKLYPGQDEMQSAVTDLRKVIRYAEMRINQLEGREVL